MVTIRNFPVTEARVSWCAIFGGVVAALSVSFLLSLLGSGLGLSSIDISQGEVADGLGFGALIYAALSVLVSLSFGGYIAGRLALVEGGVHGFLAWALSTIIAVVLSSMLISSAFSSIASVAGNVASATGSVISGAGSVIGKTASGAANGVKNLFDDVDLDVNTKAQDLTDEAKTALQKSGIPELQPDYLKSQLAEVKDEVAKAGKKALSNPNDLDAIVKKLVDDLKSRGEALGKEIDRAKLVTAFKNNTGMDEAQINKTVDGVLSARQEAIKSAQEAYTAATKQVEEAKAKLEEAKKKALEQAERAKETAAKASIWSFVALAIAAVLSAIFGHLGAARARERFVKT